jgi:hypothetical protein
MTLSGSIRDNIEAGRALLRAVAKQGGFSREHAIQALSTGADRTEQPPLREPTISEN